MPMPTTSRPILADADRWLPVFIAVSETLLDQRPLPLEAARAYLQILLRATPERYGPGDEYSGPLASPSLDQHPLDVLGALHERLARENPRDLESDLMALTGADVTLASLVRNILIVWYNGYLGNDIAPASVYPEALVWQAIGANPPGLPGPYYGHWSYPGTVPVRPPATARTDAEEPTPASADAAPLPIHPTALHSHARRRR